jgi:hypothetical protein
MTGTGSYNLEIDRFVLNLKTTGRWNCDLRYVRRGEKITLTGKCDGKPINMDRDDKDKKQHQLPNLNER